MLRLNIWKVPDMSAIFVRSFVQQKMPFAFINPDFIETDWTYSSLVEGDLDVLISSKMIRGENGDYMCLDCPYTNKTRQRLKYHIESKHVSSPGHICEFCQKICPTKNALCLHRSRYHKNESYKSFPSFWAVWLIKNKNERLVLFFSDGKTIEISFLGYIPLEADITIEQLDDIINSKIVKISNSEYRCSDCDHAFRQKINLRVHIEGRHIVDHPGIICNYCSKHCSTRDALRKHVTKCRPNNAQFCNKAALYWSWFICRVGHCNNEANVEKTRGMGMSDLWVFVKEKIQLCKPCRVQTYSIWRVFMPILCPFLSK